MALPRGMHSQEGLLLNYVQRLEAHRQGRMMVHVHLSRLEPYNRREHHIRTAANTFDGLVKMLLGQLFTMRTGDLIFIFKRQARDDVESAIVKLRFLFGDDPLMAEQVAPGVDSPFTTWYDVDDDYDTVLELARTLSEAGPADDGQKEPKPDEGPQAMHPGRGKGEPLTPRVLGRIEDALVRADLTNMVRRQYVCGLVGAGVPQPVFSELFISINDLRDTLLPGVNLTSSRWLFQHLTETLDRRILSMLSKTEERNITGDISINLNIATLLSPDFLRFDDSVVASMRGGIVIELQTVDIFADLGAYLFARAFVKERGYRICIDGLNERTIRFIDRERLGADMVKLPWNPALLDGDEDARQQLRTEVRKCGENRVILTRCDDQKAIEFGQSMGIALFQGRHVESLIAEENRRRNMRTLKKRSRKSKGES